MRIERIVPRCLSTYGSGSSECDRASTPPRRTPNKGSEGDGGFIEVRPFKTSGGSIGLLENSSATSGDNLMYSEPKSIKNASLNRRNYYLYWTIPTASAAVRRQPKPASKSSGR